MRKGYYKYMDDTERTVSVRRAVTFVKGYVYNVSTDGDITTTEYNLTLPLKRSQAEINRRYAEYCDENGYDGFKVTGIEYKKLTSYITLDLFMKGLDYDS